LFFKAVKSKVQRTAAVPVVLYAYGTRCLAFREEQAERVQGGIYVGLRGRK